MCSSGETLFKLNRCLNHKRNISFASIFFLKMILHCAFLRRTIYFLVMKQDPSNNNESRDLQNTILPGAKINKSHRHLFNFIQNMEQIGK